MSNGVDKFGNIGNTYDFKKSVQDTIIHITKMKIANTELAPQQGFKKPLDPAADPVKVVGAGNSFTWDGGFSKAVSITMQVSTANKQDIDLLLKTKLDHIDVVFTFYIYDYDSTAKKFFESVKGEDLKGQIKKNGESLVAQIGQNPTQNPVSPENYLFSISIEPKPEEQPIHCAVGDGKNFVMKWGVTTN